MKRYIFTLLFLMTFTLLFSQITLKSNELPQQKIATLQTADYLPKMFTLYDFNVSSLYDNLSKSKTSETLELHILDTIIQISLLSNPLLGGDYITTLNGKKSADTKPSVNNSIVWLLTLCEARTLRRNIPPAAAGLSISK